MVSAEYHSGQRECERDQQASAEGHIDAEKSLGPKRLVARVPTGGELELQDPGHPSRDVDAGRTDERLQHRVDRNHHDGPPEPPEGAPDLLRRAELVGRDEEEQHQVEMSECEYRRRAMIGHQCRNERYERKRHEWHGEGKAIVGPGSRVGESSETRQHEQKDENTNGGDGGEESDQQQREERGQAALCRARQAAHRDGQRLAFQSKCSQNESIRWTMPWNFSLPSRPARSSSSDANWAR